MLELFARESADLPLACGGHLTPIPFEAAAESLSAILLSPDYYEFIHTHTRLLEGVHIVTEQGLIPLKARAWLDPRARKAAEPSSVDSKQIQKHCHDLLRLSQLLVPDERVAPPDAIATDLSKFADDIQSALSAEVLRALDVTQTGESLVALLRGIYQ